MVQAAAEGLFDFKSADIEHDILDALRLYMTLDYINRKNSFLILSNISFYNAFATILGVAFGTGDDSFYKSTVATLTGLLNPSYNASEQAKYAQESVFEHMKREYIRIYGDPKEKLNGAKSESESRS